MYKLSFILISLFISGQIFAQNVGINSTGASPDASAILDVVSTDQGVLVPRVDIIDLTTAAPVTAPATSLLVYNTNSTSGPGFFYWDGTAWKAVGAAGVIGINDLADGISDTTTNVFLGKNAGITSASGAHNTGVGIDALATAIGVKNTAIGYKSQEILNTGVHNVSVGYQTMQMSTGASSNVAVGYQSLQKTTSGSENVGVGSLALERNTSGNQNVAIGLGSFSFLTSGTKNIAIGYSAGNDQTAGNNNIVIGANDIDLINLTGDNQLNIGNIIYGTGMDGTGVTVSTGNIGINEPAPNSTMDINGSFSIAIISTVAPYTVSTNDHTILVTSTGVVTLPNATTCPGRIYVVKSAGAGSVDVNGGGSNIDGTAIYNIATSNEGITVQSDGTNWYVIAKF